MIFFSNTLISIIITLYWYYVDQGKPLSLENICVMEAIIVVNIISSSSSSYSFSSFHYYSTIKHLRHRVMLNKVRQSDQDSNLPLRARVCVRVCVSVLSFTSFWSSLPKFDFDIQRSTPSGAQ